MSGREGGDKLAACLDLLKCFLPSLALRFPIDDAELHQLLLQKAKEEGERGEGGEREPRPHTNLILLTPPPSAHPSGTAPPADDVCMAAEALSLTESHVLSDLLVAADFLQQFTKQLGLPPKSQVQGLCVWGGGVGDVQRMGEGGPQHSRVTCKTLTLALT